MQIHNLDRGLHTALTIVFRNKGLSASAADAKANKHLATASKIFRAKCKECLRDRGVHQNQLSAIARAKREVLGWAQRLK
jgi:hypothetical protein